MPLPLFKLGALLAKQISKPLAKILKDKAKQSDSFKKYFVMPAASLYHNVDITLRMRVLGLGSPDKVPPLTEKAAIELGGDILSEFFVFGTAVTLIMIEYLRQASNAKTKDDALHTRVKTLENDFTDAKNKLDANAKRLTEISTFIQDQKSSIDDLSKKVNTLIIRKKFATQGVQTTPSDKKQIGKVMVAKNSKQSAESDVTNSIIYQCSEYAVNALLQ